MLEVHSIWKRNISSDCKSYYSQVDAQHLVFYVHLRCWFNTETFQSCTSISKIHVTPCFPSQTSLRALFCIFSFIANKVSSSKKCHKAPSGEVGMDFWLVKAYHVMLLSVWSINSFVVFCFLQNSSFNMLRQLICVHVLVSLYSCMCTLVHIELDATHFVWT